MADALQQMGKWARRVAPAPLGLVVAMTCMVSSTSGLTALLDALERDLLAAPKDEMRDALGATGRARDAACQEIRSLLNEALAASDDGSAAATPLDNRARTGLPRH